MTSLKNLYQTSFQGAQACSSSKLRKLEIKCSAMAVEKNGDNSYSQTFLLSLNIWLFYFLFLLLRDAARSHSRVWIFLAVPLVW